MKTFAQLFLEGQQRNPFDNGEFVRSRADEGLSGSGVALRTSIEPLSMQNGVALVVAFYSLSDLKFLDQLVSTLRSQARPLMKEPILIFDALSFKKMADFETLIPSIGRVLQTPVVGVWENGHVVEKGVGREARMVLARKYGMKAPEIDTGKTKNDYNLANGRQILFSGHEEKES
jgi:hypothetical protein